MLPSGFLPFKGFSEGFCRKPKIINTLMLCLGCMAQTAELAESQFDMMEIGGAPGNGRGKVLQASKGQAQKGRR